MRRYPYFKPETDDNGFAPSPLSMTVERVCRFEEVDVLGVAWHGRYASYFEDARLALGEKYGFGYEALHAQGVITPVKQFHVEYLLPLLFNRKYLVTADMHWTRAARMNITYCIRDAEGALCTTGYTVQLFLTLEKEVCMAQPEFFAGFCERWRQGMFEGIREGARD
ncbi:MAG: hypothetical protein DELT_00702 [Desulfovibrio sp.]